MTIRLAFYFFHAGARGSDNEVKKTASNGPVEKIHGIRLISTLNMARNEKIIKSFEYRLGRMRWTMRMEDFVMMRHVQASATSMCLELYPNGSKTSGPGA